MEFVIARTVISIGVGALFLSLGVALLLPSLMAWDSGEPDLPMRILSYSSLSVIPISIVATVLSSIFGYAFLLLNLLPIASILSIILYLKIREKLKI